MIVKLDEGMMLKVEKPSRYTGGEWNSIVKNAAEVDIRFAFCFPDTYEIGMSHLGMKILYHLLNERRDTWCERVFAPWIDMEKIMRKNGIPLFGLESREAVGDFDFMGFTLQYEMSSTNVINMIDLAGVPVLSRDRDMSHPFVCAGGPCAFNPEPLAEVIDFFVLGEGEEVTNELMDVYASWKRKQHEKEEGSGRERQLPAGNDLRRSFLEEAVRIPGVYVPSFYEPLYNGDGSYAGLIPEKPDYPVSIRKRVISDLDKSFYPKNNVVPFTSIVHDRIMLELFRGCSRGCRFCQAGFIYRPVRERSPERLLEIAGDLMSNTGYEEISLTSLSTSDYSCLEKLTEELVKETEPKKVNLSLPSLRIDSISLGLMEKTGKVRKSGLTFAPEAGTQRMRDIINKGVCEDDLVTSMQLAFKGGWDSVKLYFMIGLPYETWDDLEHIAELVQMVKRVYRDVQGSREPAAKARSLKISVSASSFVPKPFTPFQWEPQDSVDDLKKKQDYLAGKLRIRGVDFSWHDPRLSFLEAVISRGDRKVGRAIVKAWEKGCRFDGWGEHFKYELWMQAFEECEVDPGFYANRKRNPREVFPWSHISAGVTESYLLMEKQKAERSEVTPDCRSACNGCGAAVFKGGICLERDKDQIRQDRRCEIHIPSGCNESF